MLLLLTCSCRTENLLQACAEREKSDYGEGRTTLLSTEDIYVYNPLPSQPFQGLSDLIRVLHNSNMFLSGRIYSIYLPMSGSSENFHKSILKKKSRGLADRSWVSCSTPKEKFQCIEEYVYSVIINGDFPLYLGLCDRCILSHLSTTCSLESEKEAWWILSLCVSHSIASDSLWPHGL